MTTFNPWALPGRRGRWGYFETGLSELAPAKRPWSMTGNENNKIELEIVIASQRVARMRIR